MAYQLAVFVENKPGRLARVTELLAGAKINVRAITIADARDFGLVKVIVDKPGEALEVLEKDGFTVKRQEVLAVGVEDEPGGLHTVLKTLADHGLNVKDAYGFIEESGSRAILILEVEDFRKTLAIVEKAGIRSLEEDLYQP
jgi:hypothetical protein